MKGEPRRRRAGQTLWLVTWLIAAVALSGGAWADGPAQTDNANPGPDPAREILKALAEKDAASRQADQERAQAYCQQAQAALDRGEIEIAEGLFRRAHILDPTSDPARQGVEKTANLLALKLKAELQEQSRLLAQQQNARKQQAEQVADEMTTFTHVARDEQIDELMNRARISFKKGDYDLCLAAVDAALRINPDHAGARFLRDDVRRRMNVIDTDDLLQRKEEAHDQAIKAVEEMATVQNEILRTPLNPKARVVSPDVTLGGDVDRREWMRKLDTALARKVTCDFRATPLEEVVAYFREVARINIAIDPRAGIARSPVTLAVKDTELVHCLNMICRLSDLKYYKADEMVVVSDRAQPEETVRRVYDIQELTFEPRDYPTGQQLLSRLSPREQTAPRERKPQTTQRDEMGQSWVDFIRKTVAPDTWSAETDLDAAQFTIAYRNGKLVVNHTPEVHKQIDQLLGEFRKARNIHVMIQGRFIDMNKDFLEKVGVDWTGLDFTNDANDVNVGRANYNVADPVNSQISGGLYGPATWDHFSSVSGALVNPDGSLGVLDNRIGTAAGVQYLGGLTLDVAFLGEHQVRAILQAVVKHHKGTLLSSPRLVMFNGQRANLVVADLIPLIVGTTAEGPVDIRMITDGIVFEVQPFVSVDQRYITLEMLPVIADYLGFTTANFTQTIDVEEESNDLKLPITAIRAVETTVSIPDGGTIMIGGMADSREFKGYASIPFLENIPIIKYFFSNYGESTKKHTLVMLVRGDVLILGEDEPARGSPLSR